MKKADAFQIVTRPEEFFHELVTEAMQRQKVKVLPETEAYLVGLLNQFLTTENLYVQDSEGRMQEEPLALMVKEALEVPQPENQKAMFRKIGDISLYVAGYFQDSLNRKLVDVDYYIDMGGVAYQQVAARVGDIRPLYEELAEKFGTFVDVLAEVSDKTTPKTERDLLRIYETWVRTRSERSHRLLQEAGIFPNAALKAGKDWN
jgi:hypothetical protein